MSRINEKLGLKPAGKRRMMNLPKDRAQAADLTAAQCPKCGQRGAIECLVHDRRRRFCTWCNHGWEPEEERELTADEATAALVKIFGQRKEKG